MRIFWLPKWIIYTWCKQTRFTSLLTFNRNSWLSGNTYSSSSFGPRGRELAWGIADRWKCFQSLISLMISCLLWTPLLFPLWSFTYCSPPCPHRFYYSFSFFTCHFSLQPFGCFNHNNHFTMCSVWKTTCAKEASWFIIYSSSDSRGKQEKQLVLHLHLVVDN